MVYPQRYDYFRQWFFTAVRIVFGLVFLYHAYGKFIAQGPYTGIAAMIKQGVPFLPFTFWFAAFVELIGGILLIIGLAVPVASFFLIIEMLGAIFSVHLHNGYLNEKNGWEIPFIFILLLIVVGIADYGKYGLDNRILEWVRAKKS